MRPESHKAPLEGSVCVEVGLMVDPENRSGAPHRPLSERSQIVERNLLIIGKLWKEGPRVLGEKKPQLDLEGNQQKDSYLPVSLLSPIDSAY